MNACRIHVLCGLLPLASCPLIAGGEAVRRDERFGVMTHFAHGWDPAWVAKVGRSGVGSVRDEIYWREVEPQKGVFQFSERHDQMMKAFARGGLEPLVVLSFENDHYDAGATPHSAEAISAYARYGGEVVGRFAGQIKAVEIWNEYNGTFVRGPAAENRTATYLRMLRASYQEVKRVRPEVKVVGGSTAGVPLPYWEKLFAGGALEFMDALSIHPYRYDDAPEGIETDIEELVKLVKKYNHGRSKPIWVTEIGWGMQADDVPGKLRIDERVQAQFLVRAYALLLSAGVERVYWYLFRDYNEGPMGLVRADDSNSTKIAYHAMATMTRELRDAVLVGRDETAAEIHSIIFRRPSGEAVRVMWATEPRRFAAAGVTAVTDMMGRSLGSKGELQLGEAPIFVDGDVQGIPVRSNTELANSRRGFGPAQGGGGWSYGYLDGERATFQMLPRFAADDWQNSWSGELPSLTISAKEQHPSVHHGAPVSVVRRWQSERAGMVRVAGHFRGGKQGGDGVGVSIAVNGNVRSRTLLGGAVGNAIVESFDFVERVEAGTTIDFVVDPGPAASIDFDTTVVTATISTTTES